MVLIRKLHRWLGLLIGLQVLLWLSSGLVMALLDPAKVSGQWWARPPAQPSPGLPPATVLEPFELPSRHLQEASSVALGEYAGRAVYRIRHPGGETLLDAADGSPVTFGASEAQAVAHRDFIGPGEVSAVTAGSAPGRETRNHTGAYWRVDFSNAARTSIYVSASTGDILERRNAYWRVHDFFWMLHIMDYRAREDFNNPLVIGVALVAAWLGLSGFLLLFGSFRRRDFRLRRKGA